MSDTATLRPAGPDDREYVERLLAENDLPVADLDGKLDRLSLWEVDGTPVGVGGLERHGRHALLRSVAVERDARGAGHGRALCERLLTEAGDAGVDSVYLLTTTAAAFFASMGFEEIERGSAPAAIRGTTEFRDLCPATAVAMRKEVDR